MGKVLNARQVGNRSIESRIYIGRPSKWGNPFVIGRDGSRAAVIDKYRDWIESRPELISALGELRGKNVVCWCAPLPCHGDVLLELSRRYGCYEI